MASTTKKQAPQSSVAAAVSQPVPEGSLNPVPNGTQGASLSDEEKLGGISVLDDELQKAGFKRIPNVGNGNCGVYVVQKIHELV